MRITYISYYCILGLFYGVEAAAEEKSWGSGDLAQIGSCSAGGLEWLEDWSGCSSGWLAVWAEGCLCGGLFVWGSCRHGHD